MWDLLLPMASEARSQDLERGFLAFPAHGDPL